MRNFGTRTGRLAALLATALLVAPVAHAADMFVFGDIGISSATGSSSVFNSLAPTPNGSGDGDDSSQVLGGGVGLMVPMHALLPWRLNVPRVEIPVWPGRAIGFGGQEDWRFPGWETRIELGWLGSRDLEITTPGSVASNPYRSDVESMSVMARFRLDVPVNAPLTAMFGRMPVLEPLTVYAGGGAGLGFHDVETTDVNVRGDDSGMEFAYEIDAGLGYALTESVHWSVGWRYVDLGTASMDLIDTTGQPRGNFDLDLDAHEFTTSLRFTFWRVPFLEGD
jgi:opacity protein-like surface antigen